MRHRRCVIGCAVTTLALLGLAGPGRTQSAGQSFVPFTASTKLDSALSNSLVIPTSPPLESSNLVGTGEGTPIGAFTFAGHRIMRLDVEGKPLGVKEGVVVFSAANGDAIFLSYGGVVRQTDTAGVIIQESVFQVTGGRGRFLGATGSGVQRVTVDQRQNPPVRTGGYEGVISAPK
jgi:hypothetical protein